MKNPLKYIFLMLVLLLPAQSLSESDDLKYSRSQPGVALQIQKKERAIQSGLATETDPAKRKILINKLRKVQDLYYNPTVKQEAIKNLSPEFAKYAQEHPARETIDTASDQPDSINIMNAYSKDWETFPPEQKIKFCAQMKKECDTRKALDYCRFVVVKCKSFMKEEDYQQLINKYDTSPKKPN